MLKDRQMRTPSILLSLISIPLLLLIFYGRVEALQLQVDNGNANPGDNITIEITVGEYDQEQIATSAFTLSYSTDHLTLTQVESDFFDTFLGQWNSLNPVPDPLPPASVIVDGKTYTQPLLFNTTEGTSQGKTLLVGTRVKSGVPTTLFTLHFTISLEAPPGIYPVSISPTMINDVYAGYNGTGETIPVLMGAIEGENDPTLAYPVYSPDIVNGAIFVQISFIDTDNDNIDDDWEMSHFGDLTTADQTSDFDEDGYSDLQEYLNDAAGETDPIGNVYDPKVVNAPWGTGYTPNTNTSGFRFWLLIMPVILNSSLP
jgi:hypothetical protein